MCGIAGVVALDGGVADRSAVAAMTDALSHRGPNSGGVWSDGVVALGNRRLSILDLSDAGRQPLTSADGRVQLVYNGEVYNYRELRAELENAGHAFHSGTDTEVVLEAYRAWGRDSLHRLNGMFAFALWDADAETLFCARDRLGIKPFYFTRSGNRLLFASEIKALLAALPSTPAPDPQAIADYVELDYVDHTERTFFTGIVQLAPGHRLTARRGVVEVDRWWDIEPANETISDSDAREAFAAMFEDSVRLRLRSDVPVGSCLSGGLDSSAVVCVVNGLLERHAGADAVGSSQRTFSAVFPGEWSDESRFIDAVGAAATVTQHRVAVDGANLIERARTVVRAQDEPFGTTSILAQWSVMELARAGGVTVLLDGQGGDELLAGYHSLVGYRIADLVARGRLREAATETARYHATQRHSPLRTLRLLGVPFVPASARPVLRRADKRGGDLLSATVGVTAREPRRTPPGFDRLGAERYRIYRYGLPALLRYEDRNSMAFSLEARLPFLDYRLVEWSFQLPPSLLVAQGRTKALLRDSLADRLPPLVRDRPDKIGFLTPQARWLRETAADVRRLVDRRDFGGGYLDVRGVRRLLDRHLRGEAGLDSALWRAVCLDLWLQERVA